MTHRMSGERRAAKERSEYLLLRRKAEIVNIGREGHFGGGGRGVKSKWRRLEEKGREERNKCKFDERQNMCMTRKFLRCPGYSG